MRLTSDPGEAASESLATSTSGEIERLRFAILETKQKIDAAITYWYETPAVLQLSETGDVILTIATTAPTGWVMMDDGTIGSAASAATNRANADTETLFTLLWNNVSDTYAPVSSGRGASAAADFAANKTIKLLTVLGRALGVAGAGSGLTSRALGENLGAEDVTLTSAESGLPSHTHTGTVGTSSGVVSASGGTTIPIGATSIGSVTAADAAAAHNNMQPTAFINARIKL